MPEKGRHYLPLEAKLTLSSIVIGRILKDFDNLVRMAADSAP